MSTHETNGGNEASPLTELPRAQDVASSTYQHIIDAQKKGINVPGYDLHANGQGVTARHSIAPGTVEEIQIWHDDSDDNTTWHVSDSVQRPAYEQEGRGFVRERFEIPISRDGSKVFTRTVGPEGADQPQSETHEYPVTDADLRGWNEILGGLNRQIDLSQRHHRGHFLNWLLRR